jgi:hypothetical protein
MQTIWSWPVVAVVQDKMRLAEAVEQAVFARLSITLEAAEVLKLH